jgi:hypothetical protein
MPLFVRHVRLSSYKSTQEIYETSRCDGTAGWRCQTWHCLSLKLPPNDIGRPYCLYIRDLCQRGVSPPPPNWDQQDGQLEQSCRPSEGLQYVLRYLCQSISPFIVTLVAYLKLGHAISGVYMCVSASLGRKTHVLTSSLSQLGNSDHSRI